MCLVINLNVIRTMGKEVCRFTLELLKAHVNGTIRDMINHHFPWINFQNIQSVYLRGKMDN